MLEAKGIPCRYREYTQKPLNADEIRKVFELLGIPIRKGLRHHDKFYREEKLTGHEPDNFLIEKIIQHPTLLQRPIGVLGPKAVIGRPPERLLELIDD